MSADLDSIWKRARRRIKREGLSGAWRKSLQSLEAEALRARLIWRGRQGPALIKAHRSRRIDPDQVRRIAFVKLWGLGDMVMATPAISMLRSHFGSAFLFLVGSPGPARVLAGAPVFDEQVVIPREAFDYTMPSLYRALERARRLGPDLVIVSYPLKFPRVAEMVDRLGAKYLIAAQENDQPLHLTLQVPAPPERHVVEINLDLARAAGCTGPAPPAQLWLNDEERAIAGQWIEKNAPGRPRVCFHVGSIPTLWQKTWPAKYFAELGNRLAHRRHARLILLLGPEEKEAVKSVRGGLKRAPALAGPELSLRQTMALVENVDLVVAGSSAWSHVAAALGTPLVCICGPTPSSYDPWGDAAITRVVKSSADCAPCWKPNQRIACPDPRCMREISVDAVEAKVNELLDQRAQKISLPGGQK